MGAGRGIGPQSQWMASSWLYIAQNSEFLLNFSCIFILYTKNLCRYVLANYIFSKMQGFNQTFLLFSYFILFFLGRTTLSHLVLGWFISKSFSEILFRFMACHILWGSLLVWFAFNCRLSITFRYSFFFKHKL